MGKSLQEIYAMPASEIVVWEEYFKIYPFSQDRQDVRFALLCQTIANMSGRTLKDSAFRSIQDFLPDYLGAFTDKTIERQVEADKAFAQRLTETGLLR